MLDQIFDSLDISMEPFALCELHGQTTLGLGSRPFAVLHYILAGQGQVTIAGAPPIQVGPGSIVLAPAHKQHALKSEGHARTPLPVCQPVEVGLVHLVDGQVDPAFPPDSCSLRAICGRFDVAYRGLAGTMSLLQGPVFEHLAEGDRIRLAMDELVLELANPQVGTKALARALLQQCVILLLRRRHLAGDPSLSWLEGLADEKLWTALQVMLDKPEEPHTLESLAESAGMSRTTFAERFHRIYGFGPNELLIEIRLQRAAVILQSSDIPIKRVAEMVGYSSRSYFARTFEKRFSLPPSQFRSQKQT
ncbi:AraC family transcriptional regulator [Rhodovibrionaceae bacterium A322]